MRPSAESGGDGGGAAEVAVPRQRRSVRLSISEPNGGELVDASSTRRASHAGLSSLNTMLPGRGEFDPTTIQPAANGEPYNIIGLDFDELMNEFEAIKAEDPHVVQEAIAAAQVMRTIPLDHLDEVQPLRAQGKADGKVGRRAPPNPFHSPMLGRLATKKPGTGTEAKIEDPALRQNPLRGRLVVTISVNAALFMIFLQSLVLNKVETGSFHTKPKENSNLGPTGLVLYQLGGLNTNAIRQGEHMRIFWAMWMHSGWVHIGLNVLCQVQFFYMLEPDWGIIRTLITFWISGVTGNILSAIMDPCRTTVGSSGGLFGLMGAIVPYCIEFWHSIPRPLWILIFSLLCTVVTLATGLSASTDTWAHLGGFLGGLLFGFGSMTTPAAFQPKEFVLKKQVRKNPWMRWLQQTMNPNCKCGIREWAVRLTAWSILVAMWATCFMMIYESYEYKPPGSITYSGISNCCCCYSSQPGGSETRADWACDSCGAKVFTNSDLTWEGWCAQRAAQSQRLLDAADATTTTTTAAADLIATTTAALPSPPMPSTPASFSGL